MPKRRRNKNQGCCLVSPIIWPFRLLEGLFKALSGLAIVQTKPVKRQTIQRNVSPLAQSKAERFVKVSPVRVNNPHQPSVSVSISYENGQSIFLKDAQQYKSKEGGVAPSVPFMHYWPTYRDMDGAQLRWYFFWRTQIRKDNYLPTDLSYIFVHIYEILNLVEIPDPEQAANRIKVLWQAYRGVYPQ